MEISSLYNLSRDLQGLVWVWGKKKILMLGKVSTMKDPRRTMEWSPLSCDKLFRSVLADSASCCHPPIILPLCFLPSSFLFLYCPCLFWSFCSCLSMSPTSFSIIYPHTQVYIVFCNTSLCFHLCMDIYTMTTKGRIRPYIYLCICLLIHIEESSRWV